MEIYFYNFPCGCKYGAGKTLLLDTGFGKQAFAKIPLF